jgi:hypothetical protein
VKALVCLRFNQSFSFIHDFPIQLRAYEFISNFVVDIYEVVFWRN